MIPVFRLRRIHRELAVVFGIQFLFWALSGLYFSWTNINSIRGTNLRAEPASIRMEGNWVSPTQALPECEISSLDVIRIGGRNYYRFRSVDGELVLADVLTGEHRGELDQEEAVALARASFEPEAEVESVEYLTEADVGAHHEYREHPLPVWRVAFNHSSGTRVYVAAREAEVRTHRNRSWRIFDFLWMMHTMDFFERDNINNPLLRIFSLLAVSIVVSGFVLWFVTRRRPRKR